MDRPVVLTRHDPDQKRFRSGSLSSISGSRKSSPQEKTFAEEYYYRKQMQGHTPMVIKLVGGDEFRGTIEWYDRDCVKVNREGGPNIVLMKRYIVYMYKAEDEKEKRRASKGRSS
jgi:hypothetical protein